MARPRLYDDHAVFDVTVDDYFAHVEASDKRPTMAGLSYYLGFDDRDTFTAYAEYGDEFSRTVKRAKLRIEDDRWQSLIDKAAFTPGLIFDLKNNHGWKDKTEQDVHLTGQEAALAALR